MKLLVILFILKLYARISIFKPYLPNQAKKTKKSKQKFKYLENEKISSYEIKSIFRHFERAYFIEANKRNFLIGERPTLIDFIDSY